MTQQLHILYLSGFGNNYDPFRLRWLKRWRFRGVTVELVPMQWEGNETFEQKIIRIDKGIDRAAGKRIVLLGESAGGSMAVHMYARRPDDLHKVLTLCGKNRYPETVSQTYYERSPAFRVSMERLNASIDLLSDEQCCDFVSIHPLYDPTVPVKETLLPSCRRVRLPVIGHALTIGLGLTLLAPVIVHAVRK